MPTHSPSGGQHRGSKDEKHDKEMQASSEKTRSSGKQSPDSGAKASGRKTDKKSSPH